MVQQPLEQGGCTFLISKEDGEKGKEGRRRRGKEGRRERRMNDQHG
ncbi:MAG: hypothetical protein QW052_05820 [Candidatus Nitrosocaldaceae archaeon]